MGLTSKSRPGGRWSNVKLAADLPGQENVYLAMAGHCRDVAILRIQEDGMLFALAVLNATMLTDVADEVQALHGIRPEPVSSS